MIWCLYIKTTHYINHVSLQVSLISYLHPPVEKKQAACAPPGVFACLRVLMKFQNFKQRPKKKHPQLNRPALIDKTFLAVPAGRTTGWIWKIPRFFDANVGGCMWIILHTYHTSPFLLWILSAFGHGDIRRKVNKRQTTNVKTMRILGLVVLPGNQAAFKKEASRWHWVTFSNQSLKQIIPVSQYYMLYQFSRSPNISTVHINPPNFGPKLQDRDIHLAWREVSMWITCRFSPEPFGLYPLQLLNSVILRADP